MSYRNKDGILVNSDTVQAAGEYWVQVGPEDRRTVTVKDGMIHADWFIGRASPSNFPWDLNKLDG